MLRVPGSFNSKTGNDEVKIIQRWNGVRPSIKPLLFSFYLYLQDLKLKEIRRPTKLKRRFTQSYSHQTNHTTTNHSINWIESLLRTPIHDHRKYVVWRILAPYLMNIKKISYEEAFGAIMDWLKECANIARMDFNPNDRIKCNLRAALRVGYLPIGFSNLRDENRELYNLISSKMGNAN